MEKLKLNKEFRRAYGRGRSFVHPGVVTYIVKNRLGYIRVGITTGKKLGNAVNRNRARRVITAAFRECLPHIGGGYDIVFVARVRTPSLKSHALKTGMESHFRDAGIWKDFNETDTDQACAAIPEVFVPSEEK